ncbi:hypothetical protein [Streptomyces sp. NPDC058872]|uniref:hypothetical protein n=1 Tax=Streptomyces sp. NPDC058872 TaxID=3346661 RepID=UPI00367E2A11
MMYGPALEQFRLIGRWCGAQPWRKGGDPVEAFEQARTAAALLSRARSTPVTRSHDIGR